jgi:hypothetical protein
LFYGLVGRILRALSFILSRWLSILGIKLLVQGRKREENPCH